MCYNIIHAEIQAKGGFPVIAEISQVILAAMVLAQNFYGKNCLRVILTVRGNPP